MTKGSKEVWATFTQSNRGIVLRFHDPYRPARPTARQGIFFTFGMLPISTIYFPSKITIASLVRQSVSERCLESGIRCWARSGITREQTKDAPRPPLSGRFITTDNPGLKPRAILYSCFAAKSGGPLRNRSSLIHLGSKFCCGFRHERSRSQ